MIQAIGFDLDNTLYDHTQYVKGAYIDVASAVENATGVPKNLFFERIYADWQVLTSRCNHIFTDALIAYDVYSSELEWHLVEVYRTHQPTLKAYPKVVTGLKALRKAGFKLGLLTDGQLAVQKRKLRVLELENLFDVAIYTGGLGQTFYKPHPAGFLQLANQLGVVPKEMIYVGDNPLVDFQSPKRLSMHTIRVLTGEYKNLPSPEKSVDHTFPTVNDAIAWLLSWKENR